MDGEILPEQLICEAMMRTLDLDGCTASLWDGSADRIRLGDVNDDMRYLADLNFTLWQGPGPDVVTSGKMLTVTDMHQEHERWPLLLSQLGDNSIRSLVVVPLRLESNNPMAPPIGLMSACRQRPIPFDFDELFVITRIAYAISAVTTWRLDKGAGTHDEFTFPHSEIHQAIEVIAESQRVSKPDALSTLRAKAFVDGLTLRELAQRILSGEVSAEWLSK